MTRWEAHFWLIVASFLLTLLLLRMERLRGEVARRTLWPSVHETNYFVDDDCVIRTGFNDFYFSKVKE